jgi:hypothetical protein
MNDYAFTTDIEALSLAATFVGVRLERTEVAELLGVPFLIVGSEEWLDRSILSLYPRMRTVIPAELVAFRRLLYQRLKVRGVAVTTEWCADIASIPAYVTKYAPTVAAWMCLTASDERPPIFVPSDNDWVEEGMPEHTWQTELARMNAPNGFLWVAVSRCEAEPLPTIAQHARWASALLQSEQIWRFPTSTHPLRLWQAWHLGVGALEVIAMAAHEAAPLSIVSDTVALVFGQYHDRAQQAYSIVQRWNTNASTANQRRCGLALESAYLDVKYLFALVIDQFANTASVRALSRAEGALIAEVCRDARLVYRDIIALLEELGAEDTVVGRPGFEPGTKSL